MPSLITAAYVKDQFPNWETYCTRADALKTAEEMLDIAIDNAETEMNAYFDTAITSATITAAQKFHLLRIVKFNCFNFRHGDSGYKNKPQIVLDYEDTKAKLDKGLIVADSVRMDAKEREFEEDEWFTDNTNLWYEQ